MDKMNIIKNFPLKKYNSFALDVKAAQYIAIKSIQDLYDLLDTNPKDFMVLGGGSNVLFAKNYKGLIIHNQLKGKKIVRHYKKCVHVAFASGENWHETVLWCLKKNLGGIENLSLIPGTVGAAPIQNIGAYGVELKDVLVRLEAVHIDTGEKVIFKNIDCQFRYRYSIFKDIKKGQFFITKVVLRLSKKEHALNTSYGAIQKVLLAKNIKIPTIKDVSNTVIEIRQSKLPDPAKIGNAGSFFKNPVISESKFMKLQKTYPNLPNYPAGSGYVKLAAAWLIDQCGWKGKRFGDIGCHKNQALVLVNYGKGKGAAIWKLATKIQASVDKKFGVKLEPEVNLIR